MTGELTAVDVSWRARGASAVFAALKGAKVVDTYPIVNPGGEISVSWIAIRLDDGRYVQICPGGDNGLAVKIDNDLHRITMRDFGGDA